MKSQTGIALHCVVWTFTFGINVVISSGETLLWDPTPEPDIAGYKVYYGEVNSSPVMINVGNVTSRTFNDLQAGRSYFFYVTAYNESGLESDPSQQITYTKTAGNRSPTVEITSPSSGSSYTAPATIVINATASDTDGTISRVEFFDRGTLLGTDTTSPYSLTLNGVGPGNLELSARATDDVGATTISTIVNVTVSSPPPANSYSLTENWLNAPIANQVSTFTVEYDATPTSNSLDGVIGFSDDPATAYSRLATVVRFNTSGFIDARNGGAYSANSSITYAANVRYNFRLEINVPAHTYSIYVTPSGGAEQIVGSNYQFRTEQSSVTELNNFAGIVSTGGSVQVSALTIRNGTAPNQPPTISSIPNRTIAEDAPNQSVSFTINDPDTPVSQLVLSATSSNSSLISGSVLAFGGSGTNRTLTFRPQADQSGSTVVTVTVNDGQASASTSFSVNVTPVNDPPTISNVLDQSIAMNSNTGALPILIADKETAAGSLSLTAQSSNASLVPPSGLVLGGSGGDRAITVTPARDQTGEAVITITVSDGEMSTSDSFLVTVNGSPALGLKLWLRFAETLRADDSSGLQNDAILVSTPGGALELDGIDDYLLLGEGQANYTNGITIAFWAFPRSVKSGAAFLSFGNGAGNDNIVLNRVGVSGDLQLRVFSGAMPGNSVVATNALWLNQWQHFTATISSTGVSKLYKNGNEIASGLTFLPRNVVRTNNYIGRSNWAADSFYDGALDDFRVYGRVLTRSEIQAVAGTAP
jgi:hypothetical protein